MTADALLSRLDGVKQTGAGRWLARCPAHDDKHASMSIRELDDGRILLHDFAGCSVGEIVAALGLKLEDLFPERAIDHHKPRERRPFPAADVLRAVAFEILVAVTIIGRANTGQPPTDEERVRLILAGSRLLNAVDAAGLNGEGERLHRQAGEFAKAGGNLDREADHA
jgi:hypothetical protein